MEALPGQPRLSRRVNLDYHVEIAKHYYSVPHNLVHQEVEARITQKTIEIFLRGKRELVVCAYQRLKQYASIAELLRAGGLVDGGRDVFLGDHWLFFSELPLAADPKPDLFTRPVLASTRAGCGSNQASGRE